MTASQTTILLQGARIVLPDRVTDPADLLIEDTVITSLAETMPHKITTSIRSIDVNGSFVFPGFIDVHIHGATGVDTNNADMDGLRQVSRFLAQHGVTGWIPTVVPAPDEEYNCAAAAIEQLMAQQVEEKTGAHTLGIHYEGPFVNRSQCGALHAGHFRIFRQSADINVLRTIQNPNAVHFVTVAPEIDGGVDLIKELTTRGWIVSLGHTRADVSVLDKAYDAGAHHMTHFMNAMPPLHHRNPGPIAWGLMRPDVSVDIIADGIHLDPYTLRFLIKCKSPSQLCLISDSVAPTGLGDGSYQLWGETIKVSNARTSNDRGSIAGSVITISDAVKLLLSLGVNAADVALMSASNPARLLGLDDRGSIEIGKRADLVVTDHQGEVQLTIIAGRIVFER
ncbi:MAG: N-acetylglucosamine-6-phosphate deacetylase [Pyrinomonadaceae bacterium]